MSAESDAHLQQFRDAVYSQNDTAQEIFGQTPLGAIEARSIKFAKWQETMGLESESVPEIPEELLRHWVDGDIASFRVLASMDEEIAADNISANFQNYRAYRDEMQLLASDVALKIDELRKENLRRGAEQDRVTAADLVARLRDTDAQARLPKDTSALNGFSGGEQRPDDAPERLTASKVLESISYKPRSDGSVLYMVNERPAFIDYGRHIIVEDKALDDEEAILGAILLAKEKYGGAFSLTGSDAFKRKALEVMLKNNVEVRLKSPAQEMILRELAVNYPDYKLPPVLATPSPQAQQTFGASGDSTQDLPQAAPNQNEQGKTKSADVVALPVAERKLPEPVNRFAGKLIDHGAAPYDHEPKNSDSYFVTLENADGRHSTTWGVGLADAMTESGVVVGQSVELVNNGKKAVTVEQLIRDEHGSVIGKKSIDTHRNEWVVTSPELTDESVSLDSVQDSGSENDADHQNRYELTPIAAHDWWVVQREVIDIWSDDEKERERLTTELGPEPSANDYFWFDSKGNQVPTPDDEVAALQLFAKNSSRQDTHTTKKELHMSDKPEGSESSKPVLRGVQKRGGNDDYETTVLLFKGKGDYLQGFVVADGVKHQVIAHLNERKPNPETGEIKPNFIKLSKSVGEGENAKWEEVGFGNALNKRTDSKTVYFDEVLFNVGGKTVGARVAKDVDSEMHRRLGFVQERVPRPEKSAKAGQANEDSKMNAQAAPAVDQAAPAAASAQPASDAPTKRKPRAARA